MLRRFPIFPLNPHILSPFQLLLLYLLFKRWRFSRFYSWTLSLPALQVASEWFYPFPLLHLPPMCSSLSLDHTFSLALFSNSHSCNHSSHPNQVLFMCIPIPQASETQDLNLNHLSPQGIPADVLCISIKGTTQLTSCSLPLLSSWCSLSPSLHQIWAHQLHWCSNGLSPDSSHPFHPQ